MRSYSDSVFKTDLAAVIHSDNSEKMRECPCCGSVGTSGEHAQALYYSLIDDMFDVLTNDNEFNRSAAATKLITRLNEMVNTSVSIGGDKSMDTKTAKVKRINQMINKLTKFRI